MEGAISGSDDVTGGFPGAQPARQIRGIDVTDEDIDIHVDIEADQCRGRVIFVVVGRLQELHGRIGARHFGKGVVAIDVDQVAGIRGAPRIRPAARRVQTGDLEGAREDEAGLSLLKGIRGRRQIPDTACRHQVLDTLGQWGGGERDPGAVGRGGEDPGPVVDPVVTRIAGSGGVHGFGEGQDNRVLAGGFGARQRGRGGVAGGRYGKRGARGTFEVGAVDGADPVLIGLSRDEPRVTMTRAADRSDRLSVPVDPVSDHAALRVLGGVPCQGDGCVGPFGGAQAGWGRRRAVVGGLEDEVAFDGAPLIRSGTRVDEHEVPTVLAQPLVGKVPVDGLGAGIEAGADILRVVEQDRLPRTPGLRRLVDADVIVVACEAVDLLRDEDVAFQPGIVADAGAHVAVDGILEHGHPVGEIAAPGRLSTGEAGEILVGRGIL